MAHKHSIYDADAHFTINAVTRQIRVDLSKKIVQNDHKSERFTFELQRLVDGHDMSMCDRVEIHFINVSSSSRETSEGLYLVDDLRTSPGSDNVVIFSWLISGNATKYAGTLNFLVRFVCSNGESIEYAWNTAICKDITVENGINNTEAVMAEYPDVLEAWRKGIVQDIAAQTTKAIPMVVWDEDSRSCFGVTAYQSAWFDGNSGGISADRGIWVNTKDSLGFVYVTPNPDTLDNYEQILFLENHCDDGGCICVLFEYDDGSAKPYELRSCEKMSFDLTADMKFIQIN